MRDRSREGYDAPNRDKQPSDDPAFVLEVPVLKVDELDLEVSDLKAHVALRAELADLVKINVGVDVYLDKVKLEIKGLEAEALLTIKLDQVLGTLNRALEAIDNNPQILDRVVQDVDQGAESPGGGVNRETRETEPDVDRISQPTEGSAGQSGGPVEQSSGAIDRATNEAEQAAGGSNNQTGGEEGQPVQRGQDETGKVTEPDPNASREAEGEAAPSNLADLQIEEEYIDDRGRIVARALDETGNVVEEVLNEEGDVLDLSAPDEEDGESGEEDRGEVDATDAARRKAYELGVKLSDVKGTGSGGRVLVKDVKKVGQQLANGAS